MGATVSGGVESYPKLAQSIPHGTVNQCEKQGVYKARAKVISVPVLTLPQGCTHETQGNDLHPVRRTWYIPVSDTKAAMTYQCSAQSRNVSGVICVLVFFIYEESTSLKLVINAISMPSVIYREPRPSLTTKGGRGQP